MDAEAEREGAAAGADGMSSSSAATCATREAVRGPAAGGRPLSDEEKKAIVAKYFYSEQRERYEPRMLLASRKGSRVAIRWRDNAIVSYKGERFVTEPKESREQASRGHHGPEGETD